MNDNESLVCTIDEAVATIVFNRPEVLNAVTPSSMDELRERLLSLKAEGARAVILTGAGRAFCAGADLGGRIAADSGAGERTKQNLLNHYNPAIKALAELEIPIVTAVNGAAAGIGCSLALAGDIVVAGRSAYFLQAFVNIGFVPDGGATALLPRVAGLSKALKMMMLGERIYGPDAEAMGLIAYCVDDDKVMAQAREVAVKLASGPTLALGMIRRLARESHELSFDQALAREAEAQKKALETRDAEEGVQAFLEKRPPNFTGH